MMSPEGKWRPLAPEKLLAIRENFGNIFPETENGKLAERISAYWIEQLHSTWETKPDRIREKDLGYDPSRPLSRIEQHAMVIAYADSVCFDGEPTLETLDRFFETRFPAVQGLHLLPACSVVENRFNDGYFSQVERNRIHPRFGTNSVFAKLMEKYFSMADFVLNHVDIANPAFQAYLSGDDSAGRCFYVFSEPEYQARKAAGDFEKIFRPRPFPLFTLFRRTPSDPRYGAMSRHEKYAAVKEKLAPDTLPVPVIGILSVFDKVCNDQMLFEDDYGCLTEFRRYLERSEKIDPDFIFTLSETQETEHPPYIFRDSIRTRADLLRAIGIEAAEAGQTAAVFEKWDPVIFGEPVRAMTTFSHVQVDVNTSTFQGLRMLADDFSWYLGLDLNLLRLDAANYAFKKWKTTCFGLPEVKRLMRILYLSMDAVSPRTVANLEVNDTLGTVLSQMADTSAPPPMMYDFHLAGTLPAVFNTGDTNILDRIPERIAAFDIPEESIRFSVAESHDGKSVRGSLDILTISERRRLAGVVLENGGRIKYKAVPARQIDMPEFDTICREAGIETAAAIDLLFETPGRGSDVLHLKDGINSMQDVAEAFGQSPDALSEKPALQFLIDKLLYGREPYELCVSTRDALLPLDDPKMEADRFLAFYTMAFALMGRNVKSIFFNDLMGLGNDYDRMQETGELRDIKRTRSEFSKLSEKIDRPDTFHHFVARGINELIAVIDNDPALCPKADEARTLASGNPAIAVIHNRCRSSHSFVAISTSGKPESAGIDFNALGFSGIGSAVDRLSGSHYPVDPDGRLKIDLEPFGRLWLSFQSA